MTTLLQNWLQNHKKLETSGRKLALVAGPGGNAGIVTSGILAAMVKLGAVFPNAHHIGISVGAYNWLYLLAEDYEACTIYPRFYADGRFINPWRLIGKRPVLNLDYVLEEVTEHHLPIDYAKAAKSSFKVSALTTDTAGHLHLLPLTHTSKQQIKNALRATATMPYLGRTHNLHAPENWDGWLVEHQLLPYLQSQGVTDVIWILNRSLAQDATWHNRLLWHHITRKFKRHNPALTSQIRQRRAAGNFLAHPPSGLHLEVIHPPVNVRPNERNPQTLFQALGVSYNWMATYLNHPNLPYPAEWSPWHHHMPRNSGS